MHGPRLGAVLAVIATMSASASGALVSIYEPFNYDPSTSTQLTGHGPDASHQWYQAGPGGGDASTGLPHPAAGNLTVPAAMPGATANMAVFGGVGEGTRINLTADNSTITTNGTTLYYSLALRVSSVNNLTSVGQILTCFTQYLLGGTGSQSSLGAVVWVKPGSDANHYKLGMSSHGDSTQVVWDEAHDYPTGSTQFVVADYTLTTSGVNADDVSRMWINPTSLGGAEPSPNIVTSIHDFSPSATQGDMNFFGTFELRRPPTTQTFDFTDVNSIAIDELRVGESYAAVTPVPEPAAVALLGIARAAFVRVRGRDRSMNLKSPQRSACGCRATSCG